MKLNKKLFLIFLILLILIIPHTIYANEVDLDVNSDNMMGDDYNLKLNQDNSPYYQDLNSVNGMGDVKNEISSANVFDSLFKTRGAVLIVSSRATCKFLVCNKRESSSNQSG